MNRLIILLSLPLLAACTTPGPNYNCDEACALQNMICTGQSMGTADTQSSAVVNGNVAGGSASTQSKMFHCVKDATKRAEILQYQDSANKKAGRPELIWKCTDERMAADPALKTRCEHKPKLSEEDRWKFQPGRLAGNQDMRKICQESGFVE